MRMPSTSVALLGIAAACTVGNLDYTGKRCPCPDTWTCVNDTCQRNASEPTVPGEGGAGNGAYRVSNLRAKWTTPNTIFWEWDVDGRTEDFGRFELTVAERGGGGPSKTWTSSELPELGHSTLQTRWGTTARVTSTITSDHTPDTAYSATLSAFDNAGRRVEIGPVVANTAVPLSSKIVLFADARPAGYPLPNTLAIAAGCGANGTTSCIRYIPANDPEKSCTAFGCGQNVRWQELGVATNVAPAATFARAFLELHLRSSTGQPSYYSTVWLYTQYGPPPACESNVEGACTYELNGWTYKPDSAYRKIQVPLRVLGNEQGQLLTYERFASGAFGFNVYAQWGQDATVEIDEVAIFY